MPVTLPSQDEWFTRDPRYLELMRGDALMTRAVTQRFHRARIELAEHYMSLAAPLGGKPCGLVLSRVDPMIDGAAVRELFMKLSGGTGIVIELPGSEHYLDFTSARDALWRLKASFASTFAG